MSFREFLRFRDISWEEHSRASEARVYRQLEEFLETGGFPEVVLASPEWRDAILDEYADLVFYKDLIDGFGIFHKLRSRRGTLHYLANGHEVDLVSCEEDPVHAWNVTWSLNEEKTRDRELASLHWARKTYPQMPCDLIAHEAPEPWKESIKLTPAWKFLLAKSEDAR